MLSIRSDLRGVGLAIKELGWSKPASATGALAVDLRLGETPQVNALRLSASGLEATGRATLRADGGLDVARFDKVQLGGWLDAQVDLIGQGANTAPRLLLRGGRLDMRSATFAEGGGDPAPGDKALVARLDQLQITDSIALTDFSGEFAMRGGMDGPFSGRINGGTQVTGRIVPREGRSALRVVSDDAGGVFRDAGLLKQGRDGAFSLTLLPIGQPGNFDGTLRVTNTRITDAPAMAALLNAVSIVGLVSELAGQGITFGEVNARFRLSPSQITLYESSATGPSIGISMDGVYDMPTERLAMEGVISPVYLLNGIGSLISRRGEGLIGFNYRLTGPTSAPSVQVNPLSVLAPGIVRDIFRSSARPAATTSGDPPAAGRSTPQRGGAEGDR